MIYKKIKDLRDDKDLTQQEVANYLQISRSAYQNYESGIRGISIEILASLADFHSTSVDYLIGRTKIKQPYPKE